MRARMAFGPAVWMIVRAHGKQDDACSRDLDCEDSKSHRHMPTRIVLGILVMMSAFVCTVNAGGKDTLAAVVDFRPGDTLHYTTDGSIPDRSSPFVVFGANEVVVTKTTTFKARLYRPGFLPSEVQTRTVYLRESAQSDQSAMRK